MEEATITQDQQPSSHEQPLEQGQQPSESLYQQGRFPSVITTDDLVFELGKQAVNNLNHEKIIDNLLKNAQTAKSNISQAKELQLAAEQRVEPLLAQNNQLTASNQLYVANNRKLDAEIVSLHDTIDSINSEAVEKENTSKITIKNLNKRVRELERSSLNMSKKPDSKKGSVNEGSKSSKKSGK